MWVPDLVVDLSRQSRFGRSAEPNGGEESERYNRKKSIDGDESEGRQMCNIGARRRSARLLSAISHSSPGEQAPIKTFARLRRPAISLRWRYHFQRPL